MCAKHGKHDLLHVEPSVDENSEAKTKWMQSASCAKIVHERALKVGE